MCSVFPTEKNMLSFRSINSLRRRLRIFKNKYCYALTYLNMITLLCIIIILYQLNTVDTVWKKYMEKNKPVIALKLPYVAVHLDLKGAPPRMDYLKEILRTIKNLGSNALLVEYEDMFPYDGVIADISSPYHYDREELKDFLQYAHELKLNVIPLVQTFGHFEFALKLKRFEHLRENRRYPDAICPSRKGSLTLIREMLTQIISFHKNVAPVKYLHVGCDEVYQMNQCFDCKRRNLSSIASFMNHVSTVAKMVKSLSPDTTILIWDDMMRTFKPSDWVTVHIPKNVQPVIWFYGHNIEKSNIKHYNLYEYQKAFKSMWAAAAFKGADGKDSIQPRTLTRYTNVYNWLRFIHNYGKRTNNRRSMYDFTGVILTGWSRYDHFSPLCDLLPMAISSLVVNLMLIAQSEAGTLMNAEGETNQLISYEKHIMREFREFLECDDKASPGLARKESLINYQGCVTSLAFPLNTFLEKVQLYFSWIQSEMNWDTLHAYAKSNSALNSSRQHLSWCLTSNVTLTGNLDKLRTLLAYYYENNVIEEYVKYESDSMYRYFNKCITLLNYVNTV